VEKVSKLFVGYDNDDVANVTAALCAWAIVQSQTTEEAREKTLENTMAFMRQTMNDFLAGKYTLQ